MTKPKPPGREWKVWVAPEIGRVVAETGLGVVWSKKRQPYQVRATLRLSPKGKGKRP